MSKGVNKVILVGNLGNDPDVRYTQSGTAITSISLATTSVRKDRDGNIQEKTQWHRVKFIGRLAEVAGEYLHKGRQVYVEGSINYDKYTDKDGQERFVTEIIADAMQMLGGGKQDEAATPSAGASGQTGAGRQQSARSGYANRQPPARAARSSAPAPATAGGDDPFDDPFDDDMPF